MRNRVIILVVALILALSAVLYVLFTPNVDANEQTASSAQARGAVLINEVMVSNPGVIADDTGEFPDWVELYNPSATETINISSWGLSNDPREVKWAFPAGTELAPQQYLVIYCDGSTATPVAGEPLHANFKIKAGTKPIVLTDAAGHTLEEVLSPAMSEGQSWGRVGAEAQEFAAMTPSPGFSNDEAGVLAYQESMMNTESPLLINEFQPSNRLTYAGENGDYPDWIEITNPSSSAIDISGHGLSDERTKPMKWKFPEGTTIEAGEILLIPCDGTKAESEGLHASLNLNSYQDSVVLSDEKARTIDAVDYHDVGTDRSYGRDENNEWRVFVNPTPGYPNTNEGRTQFEADRVVYVDKVASDVYISEVMMANRSIAPDPSGEYYDWIELCNMGATQVDISGYGLSNDSSNPAKWRFPQGTNLEPGGRRLFYCAGAFVQKAKEDEQNASQYVNFKLDNIDGEVLTLWNAQDQLVDEFRCETQWDYSSTGKINQGGAVLVFPEPMPGQEKSGGYTGYVSEPKFETAAGLYLGAQTVYAQAPAEGVTMRYTTDGTTPTEASAEWPGSLQVDKTQSIRLRSFSHDELLPSRTATATYIIDSPHRPEFTIVSLTTDPANLFDEETGIYVLGPNPGAQELDYPNANFWQDWERPAYVEIFSSDENGAEISQDIGIRIFGDYGRLRDQKAFALINRSAYGHDAFEAPIFANRPYEEYQSLVLRCGSQDATVTKIHDVVATSLVDGTTNLEVQAYKQAVLYVNGQYFGYYHIREKINKYWIEQHYGIAPDNLDLLVGNGTALVGDDSSYKAMIDYCATHDLSNDSDYQVVADQIDVDNYIDYLIAEMFVANTDTGNIKFFREHSKDPEKSKWRWIYYDFCWSFMPNTIDMDSFAYLTNPEGHGVRKMYSTQLSRSLFQNTSFQERFLQRFAVLLNSIYQPENVLATIDSVEDLLRDEKPRDGERWPADGAATFAVWEKNMSNMRLFAQERRDYCIGFLRMHFNLDESEAIELFGSIGKSSAKWTGGNESSRAPEVLPGTGETAGGSGTGGLVSDTHFGHEGELVEQQEEREEQEDEAA